MKKFMCWVESIDPFVVPIALDVAISVLSAWLILGTMEFLASIVFGSE